MYIYIYIYMCIHIHIYIYIYIHTHRHLLVVAAVALGGPPFARAACFSQQTFSTPCIGGIKPSNQ